MQIDFTGKVALVKGAANGIGAGAARAFAGLGARVVLVDRDVAAGEALAAGIRGGGGKVRFVTADVTRSADDRATFRRRWTLMAPLTASSTMRGSRARWRPPPSMTRRCSTR